MKNVSLLISELQAMGITNTKVLGAIERIPREQFILNQYQAQSYDNIALPIQCHQTISQPFIVALMTQALFNHPAPKKILEIGTGSGYQAAILSVLFDEVYSIERIKTLYLEAKNKLHKMHFTNIHYKWDDGEKGWRQFAPYDGILVTACSEQIPVNLLDQLSSEGGVLIIPLITSEGVQGLYQVQKEGSVLTKTHLDFVSFVPLLKNVIDK